MHAPLDPDTTVQGQRDAYVVEAALGGGGFAETVKARRASDGAAVALKLLRLDRTDNFKALELFEREASVLTTLEHPGIPTVFELFVWDGENAYAPHAIGALPEGKTLRWVMVQSFAPGRSLAQRMTAAERMDTARVEAVLRSLLDVLQYLHGLHPPIIHRDITPANVVIDDESGRVTLVDFGAISHRLRSANSVASTSVGTFGFMPMEQMMGQARPASDLYALAVTMVVAASHRGCEELPLDERTNKIDLAKLALQLPIHVHRTLDGMLEPVIGQRMPDAASALALLDPKMTHPAVRQPAKRYAWLWHSSMGFGGLAAAVIYLGFFSSLSETMLIRVSAGWVAPVAFGVAGTLSESAGRPKPIASALRWTGIVMALLIFFIYVIFPGL